MTKDLTSDRFDIIWLRLQTSPEVIVLCFFYAPHEKHSEANRVAFYDELAKGYAKYQSGTKIFMMGDANARSGQLSNDCDIHGTFITNTNKGLFLGFLRFSGMR